MLGSDSVVAVSHFALYSVSYEFRMKKFLIEGGNLYRRYAAEPIHRCREGRSVSSGNMAEALVFILFYFYSAP